MLSETILGTIGKTPMVKLQRMARGLNGEVFVKLESMNPCSSVKDRITVAMIEAAEAEGTLKPGATIIEPTSGNTGIGLAMTAAVKGYQLKLIMPDTMSPERRSIMRAFGAEIVLTPGAKGMRGAVEEATRLHQTTPASFMPQQFENAANPEAHRRTTAKEILEDLGSRVDYLVSGIGTGGTVTGVGEAIKKVNPLLRVIGVEPEASPVLSGGKPGPHKIQGIGAGFVPKILNRELLDEVLQIKDMEAGEAARALAKQEGILAGISAGANVAAALKVAARQEAAGKRIVTFICDTGERYLSTWLFNFDPLEEPK